MSTESEANLKIIIAACLGICIAFVVATLSTPHLDFLLSVSLGAFVVAMPPLLIAYYMFMVLDHEPQPLGSSAQILGRSARLLVSVSVIPVVIGFAAALWHFGLFFVCLFFASAILGFVVYVVSFGTMLMRKR